MFSWIGGSQAWLQDKDGSLAEGQGGLATGEQSNGVAHRPAAPMTASHPPPLAPRDLCLEHASPHSDTLFAGMQLTRPRRCLRRHDGSVTTSTSSQSGMPGANTVGVRSGMTPSDAASCIGQSARLVAQMGGAERCSEASANGVSAFAFLAPQAIAGEGATTASSDCEMHIKEEVVQEGMTVTHALLPDMTAATSATLAAMDNTTGGAPRCISEPSEGAPPGGTATWTTLESCEREVTWHGVCEAEGRLRELAAEAVRDVDMRGLHVRTIRASQTEMQQYVAVEAYSEADRCRAEAKRCATAVGELEARLDVLLVELDLAQASLRDSLQHLAIDIRVAMVRAEEERFTARSVSVAAAERARRAVVELDEALRWRELQESVAGTVAQGPGANGPTLVSSTADEREEIAAELRAVEAETASIDVTIAALEVQLAELRGRRTACCDSESRLQRRLRVMERQGEFGRAVLVTPQQDAHDTEGKRCSFSELHRMQHVTPSAEGTQHQQQGHDILVQKARNSANLAHLAASVTAALRVVTSADVSDEDITEMCELWASVVSMLSQRCHGRWWLFAENFGHQPLHRSSSGGQIAVDDNCDELDAEEMHDAMDKIAAPGQDTSDADTAPSREEDASVKEAVVALRRERQLLTRVACLRHGRTLAAERVQELSVRLKGLNDALHAAEQAKLKAVQSCQFQTAQARVNEARELAAAVEHCMDEHDAGETKVRRYDTLLCRTRERLSAAHARSDAMRRQCIVRYQAGLAAALRQIDNFSANRPLVLADAVARCSAANGDGVNERIAEAAALPRHTSAVDDDGALPHDECTADTLLFSLHKHRAAMRELLLALQREAEEAIDVAASHAAAPETPRTGCAKNGLVVTDAVPCVPQNQ